MKIQSLGILGLGSRSTLFYIKELNRLYHKKRAGYSTCPFTLLNTNFDVLNNLLPKPSNKLKVLLSNYLTELSHLQVDAVLVPNITLHETIDKLSIMPKIIHPVHLTIAKLKDKGFSEIILFGSLHTMESDYLKWAFNNQNIAVSLPAVAERVVIEDVRKHIYWETESKELMQEYADIIKKYSSNNALVLACTELSVAWTTIDSNIFDMSRIQIEAAVENID
ncbi:aspartate/glutamate racemase family protein [Flavobacterium sp. AC]|uniref:Aspartate/glutamate racemase family protein n=1 Tax=Flavobacterium azizsancarii TaxID=2961580 RepID=A0ABT4WE36_9FLAO|nr:aspartate/glutamate racemase family protein [Flavobacterium azizsancarii]MDA6070845.1 aspartate/glutamate racemase family protein [Flavobacterium azizsancarii]